MPFGAVVGDDDGCCADDDVILRRVDKWACIRTVGRAATGVPS
jgi:hypothetical protein